MKPQDAEKLGLKWREDKRSFNGNGSIFWAEVTDGRLMVIVAKENEAWHLSISHRSRLLSPFDGSPIPGRYPTWDEIAHARYALLPDDRTFGILLPPKAEYINLHPTCFHLHEVPGDS
jgi:hypothetical protein